MSMLAAELGNVEHAAPALDTPHPSADGDLEADLKDVLSQLKRREPGFPTPSPLRDAIKEAPEAAVLPRLHRLAFRTRLKARRRNDGHRRNAA